MSTLFQTIWDTTDPVNHAPDWTDHVFLTAGTADSASLIDATNAVAAAAGVPLIDPVAHPSPAHDLRGLAPASVPVHANVVVAGGGTVTGGLRQVAEGGHFVAFTDKQTRSLWRGFLSTFAGSAAPTIAPVEPPPPTGDPPPANDDVADAFLLDPLPYSDAYLTGAASTEPGEPQPCGETGATVWYRITPDEDVVVDIDTFGSTFDTVLAVYAGDGLAPVDCNDDSGATLQSRVVFDAAAGTTYLMQAGGFASDHGTLVFNAQAVAPPPPPPPGPVNDLFDDATVIEALPYSDTLVTDGASSEPDEPQPCGAIGATVWYRFTPKEDTVIDLDTFGSGFDTALAVYTGNALESLEVVDCNDDAEGLQSRIVFEATAGTTYLIQAGGFAGDHGELSLNTAASAPQKS